MSAFKCVKTKMKEVDLLIKAIEKASPAFKGKIVTGKNLPVYGYHGDDRTALPKGNKNWAPKAVAVIPGMGSKHGPQVVPGASNDLAVAQGEDGNLIWVCSQNESHQFGPETPWWKGVEKTYGMLASETEAPKALQEFLQSAAQMGHKTEVSPLGWQTIDDKNSVMDGSKVMQVTTHVKKKMTLKEFYALKEKGHNLSLAGKAA